jgi:hypothetical protein
MIVIDIILVVVVVGWRCYSSTMNTNSLVFPSNKMDPLQSSRVAVVVVVVVSLMVVSKACFNCGTPHKDKVS